MAPVEMKHPNCLITQKSAERNKECLNCNLSTFQINQPISPLQMPPLDKKLENRGVWEAHMKQ